MSEGQLGFGARVKHGHVHCPEFLPDRSIRFLQHSSSFVDGGVVQLHVAQQEAPRPLLRGGERVGFGEGERQRLLGNTAGPTSDPGRMAPRPCDPGGRTTRAYQPGRAEECVE